MPPKISLRPNTCYHIFNRGNNRENIFFEPENYAYFLRLYAKHIHPIVHTYAYALLPNHFHFLICIKDESMLLPQYWSNGKNRLHQPFSNLFNAYAKAINLRYQRVSSLFEDRYERVELKSDFDFTRLVYYVHVNPQKHGYVKDFRTYPYSSYSILSSEKPSNIDRETVLTWFGGRESFLQCHSALHRDWMEEYHMENTLDD